MPSSLNRSNYILIAIILFVVLIGGIFFWYIVNTEKLALETGDGEINKEKIGFDECVAAGYPVLDFEIIDPSRISPRRCTTSEGKVFVEEIIEQSLHELIVNQFCSEYVSDYTGSLLTADYDIQSIDLNNDGLEEVIAGSGFCFFKNREYYIGGNNARPFVVLQKKDGEWSKVFGFDCNHYLVETMIKNNYHDIVVYSNLGCCMQVEKRFEWDGSKYELTDTKQEEI